MAEIIGDRVPDGRGGYDYEPRPDRLSGTDDDDQIFGFLFADVLSGGVGNDRLDGGEANDTLKGGKDIDGLYGLEGDDDLDGGEDDDFLDGGDDQDKLDGGKGADTLFGRDGNDTLAGGAGDDEIVGQEGDDVIIDVSGKNSLGGNDGNDTIKGSNAGCTLGGGDGADLITGGSGHDFIFGTGVDPDSICIALGKGGDDQFFSGAGADLFDGAAGNDRFEKNFTDKNGEDDFLGGKGYDYLDYGDFGAATIKVFIDATKTIGSGYRGDRIEDFTLTRQHDEIVASYDLANGRNPLGVWRLEIRADDRPLDGTKTAGDTITVIDSKNLSKFGTDLYGAHVIGGGRRGGDEVRLGNLNDFIEAGDGSDTLDGGAGDDTIWGGAQGDEIRDRAGNDFIRTDDGLDEVYGGLGRDQIYLNDFFNFKADKSRDIVYYDQLKQSNDKAGVDGIGLFDPRLDEINLTELDGNTKKAGFQHLDLVNKFTGKAGQAVVEAESPRSYTIHIDSNGDRKDDMTIEIGMLEKPVGPTEAWLLL